MPIEMTSHTIIDKLSQALRVRVDQLITHGYRPHLAVVLVGYNPQSELYVSSIKRKQAEDLGIDFTIHRLDESATQKAVCATIDELNRQSAVTGIIVQLPLPSHLDTDGILAAVDRAKDVDGLAPNSPFMPPTVQAIMTLFEAYDIKLKEKRIVLIGLGRLVGAPLMKELKRLRLDVTACDESVTDLASCTLGADILISATGQHHLIQPSMIKEGAVIIDVDKEVDYEAVLSKAGYITPQKGGVGPLTVTYLLKNVVEAAEQGAGYDQDKAE